MIPRRSGPPCRYNRYLRRSALTCGCSTRYPCMEKPNLKACYAGNIAMIISVTVSVIRSVRVKTTSAMPLRRPKHGSLQSAWKDGIPERSIDRPFRRNSRQAFVDSSSQSDPWRVATPSAPPFPGWPSQSSSLRSQCTRCRIYLSVRPSIYDDGDCDVITFFL